VLKTESVPQIVIVTSTVVILKSLIKLSVHLVTPDVTLVLLTKLVSLVPKEELTTPQLVTVQPINSKMPHSNVMNVTTDVLNVTPLQLLVLLVPMLELMLQVVIVQMVFMMMDKKTQFVNNVVMSVLLV